MRYPDRIISYHISESCSESKSDSMKEAFDIIESKTVLKFNPVSKTNSQINILCADVSSEPGQEDYFVAGEGGPSRVIDSKRYSVIEGKIALYREGTCNNANVATHELLHALGFDHNNKAKSILYPTLKCNQVIDPEIIDSINSLYSVNSLPDLLFSTINATKAGRYLNFHMEVLNQGLVPTNNVSVGIYADNVFVESFDLNTISIGSKKIIDVENLRISLNTQSIKFKIDYKNEISEISEDNNELTLRLVTQ